MLFANFFLSDQCQVQLSFTLLSLLRARPWPRPQQRPAGPGVLLSSPTRVPAAAHCLRGTMLSLLTAHRAQKLHGRDWQTHRKQRPSYGSRPSDAVTAFCPRLHSYVSPETRGRSQCADPLLFAHDFPSPTAHQDWFFKNHLSTWPLRVINH